MLRIQIQVPDPGPGWKIRGSGIKKIQIRDKHPPDPQHCCTEFTRSLRISNRARGFSMQDFFKF
jgi:hypothetical protein